MIHVHEFEAENEATYGAQTGAHDNDYQREFYVVPCDGGVSKTEGFEDGDLFTLQCDLPTHHGVRHERGDAQEYERKPKRQPFQNADLIVDSNVGGMLGSTISAEAAIGFKNTIHVSNDLGFRSTGSERKRECIERTFEIKRFGKFLFTHPKNSERFVVGQRTAGASFEDVLRCEHDAGYAEFEPAAVENRGNGISGIERIRIGKSFTHEHLQTAGTLEETSAPEVESIEQGGAPIGHGVDQTGSRFQQLGKIQGDTDFDPGFDGRDSRNGGEFFPGTFGGPFQIGKDLGEVVFFVVTIASLIKRTNQAAGHDHHGQTARHHQGHRERL